MIILFLTSVALIELVRRLPLLSALASMSECSQHAVRLLRSHGSDWSKERAMRLVSRRLMARSLYAGGVLLMVASPLTGLLVATAYDPKLDGLGPSDWTARLWVLPFTLGYAALRWRIGKVRVVQPR